MSMTDTTGGNPAFGTFAELAEWLQFGEFGVATDYNNILYQVQGSQVSPRLAPLTEGLAVPVTVTAAYQAKLGDRVVLGVGGLPTLPSVTPTEAPGIAPGVSPNQTTGQIPVPQPGQQVTILNTTGSAINVSPSGSGATINGSGSAYALAAGATKSFRLDSTGKNWLTF